MIIFKCVHKILISIFLGIALLGCSNAQGEPAATIEAYITALSEQDANIVSSLSCADWEQSALAEVDSFTAVSIQVQDLACGQSGQEDSTVYVTCSGKLALDYGGEAQEIDLADRTYLLRQEGGEWRMCGYR